MKQLENKITLVTGATRGIGKGIAIGLGEAGATVYITGRTLEDVNSPEQVGSLKATQQAVEQAGGKCIPVQVDHSNDDQVEKLFERIKEEQNGQLDLLVNNAFAGVQALADVQGKPFWDCEPHLWDSINNVGLRSHYMASVFAARMMTKRRQGLICTISSWGGMSYIFGAAYGIGKAACDRMAADLAVELKPYNVTSLSLWPGIVGTETITRLFAAVEGSNDEQPVSFGEDRYNWETPLFTGRTIAALTADPNIMNLTGRVQIVAELAQRYNIVDLDGNRPVSMRSLRFLTPFAIPVLKNYPWLVPDLKVPWFLLLLGALPSPKI